tara:strand:+ start:888 stop:2015 length:1128 start_codon:yes stop_codon:yes gene_type:complete
MIFSTFPQKDATLYEATRSMNTGLDAILELTKHGQTSSSLLASGSIFNTRILLQFDLSEISSSITAGTIGADAKYYLNLYTCEANEVTSEYAITAHPVSESWTMGTGKYFNDPSTTDGCSWKYRTNETDGTEWTQTGFATGTTGSDNAFQSEPGGGTFYTSSVSSQSFSNESSDVRMDVTDIVKQWISGSIDNHGFLIKRSGSGATSQEFDTTAYGSLKFFSSDTSTVYPPRLEAAWDDSSQVTSSLSELTEDDILLYLKNNRGTYKQDAKAKFRVTGRERFPVATFATKSEALTVKHLPTSSYYSVKDAHSEETIIPFDTGSTKISCDSSGNFFKLWMSGLQPERYYRFVFRVDRDGGNRIEYFDDNFIFKVVR